MSIRLMSEVWKTNLPTTEKMVLLVIADHAGDDGTEAWPSQQTIANKCSISVRTVQRCVNTLVKHKYIWLEKRAGGSVDCREDRRPNRYTINLTKLRGDSVAGRTDVANDTTLTPATGRHTRPMNHPLETSIKPSFDEFWEIYPRKTAKGSALKAYEKALKKASAEVIIAGAKKYRQDPLRKPDFTAHPATWLNGERWLDENPEAVEKPFVPTPTPERYNPAEYENKEAVPMSDAIREMLRSALRK